MAKAHDRILQLTVATDDSAETLAVTAASYCRTRANLDAGTCYSVGVTPTTPQTTPAEIQFDQALPPPTHLRFVFTAVA